MENMSLTIFAKIKFSQKFLIYSSVFARMENLNSELKIGAKQFERL